MDRTATASWEVMSRRGEQQQQLMMQAPARHAAAAAGEPVRSRWTPKPEQILILESIFNSGMVNPAKDETARIRRLLERFGAVRDANMGLMARHGGGDHHYSSYADSDATQLSYQPTGTIQVFINGVAYDVPSGGALDMAGTFGRDAMLVHSSGEVLPVDEHGVLINSLQMGECYYLL
uniref:Uncharacterized protein n=1 Tax=Oryza barthii TaxID=65489 RepID=A0A0D3GXV1_9ORYZ